MKGVVFTGGRELELMDFPDPTPGEGDVVIEMKASGMCGSDLHQYRRPKGGSRRSEACPPTPIRSSPDTSLAALWLPAAQASTNGRPGSAPASWFTTTKAVPLLRPLPLGMEPALSGAAGKSVRQQRQWRPRQIFVRAGQHTRTAAG